MTEERRGGLSDGIRTGIGILAAVKEALAETIGEAVDRGDLTQERARAVVRETAQRLQETLDDARDRMDLIPRRDFEALRQEVADLKRRVDLLESGGAALTGSMERLPPAEPREDPGGSIPVD